MQQTPLQVAAIAAGAHRGRIDEMARLPWHSTVPLTRAARLVIVRKAYPVLWGPSAAFMLWRRRHVIESSFMSGYQGARYAMARASNKPSHLRIVRPASTPKGA
ncbi:MAG: hypothetical protein JWO59_704 [Chloroflexi bacterium]|nr:hypothetical protein [Chloroflexota bacterium]